MRRACFTLGVAASLAAPAAAQLLGEPVWNSPTGGGVAISADYAKPNNNYGSGAAWGARVAWGVGTTTFTLGAANWTPQGAATLTSLGGDAAFRLLGGTLLPIPSPGIWANVQVGVAHTDVANSLLSAVSATAVTGAVGVGARLQAPRFSVEPYVSPGLRYRSMSGGGSTTEFGYAIGANVSFGFVGVHAAYDNETVTGGGTVAVFGVGVHLTP